MTTLYNPKVIINNKQIYFKPNSVTTVDGLGETSVEALSAGGGSITTAHSEDVSTKVSVVKAKLDNTTENAELIRGWKTLIGANFITVQEKDYRGVFFHMSLTTDPEKEFKNLPEVEVEFKGDVAL